MNGTLCVESRTPHQHSGTSSGSPLEVSKLGNVASGPLITVQSLLGDNLLTT